MKPDLPLLSVDPIGVIETCFQDKFGVPRQPFLAPSAPGVIHLKNHDFFRRSLEGLEGFSHLWVLFWFHKHDAKNWKPSVRPPRLGGAKRVGVLASRSPHRPNPIGISVLKIESIDLENPDGPKIHVSGVDLVSGTPVLDIKPYLPYCDSYPEAKSGWALEEIKKYPVLWSDIALRTLEDKIKTQYPNFKTLAEEILSLDPRPAFQKRNQEMGKESSLGLRYGFMLFEYDVKYEIQKDGFLVFEIK